MTDTTERSHSSDRIQARILKGFRDFLPADMIARRRLIASVTAVFERYGFSPIDTPTLEYADVVLGKYGGDTDMQVYRFLDNGKRDVCMRFELTGSLARVVAMYPELPRPFKRYQIGNVWRAENPARGRFREFVQCDVDTIGVAGPNADAECLALAWDVAAAVGVGVRIEVNSRKVFGGLQRRLGIADDGQMSAVLRAVDKLSKIGVDGVRSELERHAVFSPEQIARILEFLGMSGGSDAVLARLDQEFAGDEAALAGIAELRAVVSSACAMGVPSEALVVVPSLVRGADYYTGVVFEVQLTELAGYGTVMAGGRYDGLIGAFTGQAVPAVGISVGLDRLLAAMLELGRISSRKTAADVLVTVFGPEQAEYSASIAHHLRGHGINAELYLECDKFKKQMKYASSIEVPLVVVAGPDEASKRMVALKDMRSGEQQSLGLDELAAQVRQALGR